MDNKYFKLTFTYENELMNQDRFLKTKTMDGDFNKDDVIGTAVDLGVMEPEEMDQNITVKEISMAEYMELTTGDF